MPLLSSISSLNEKVNSARIGFNSTLDKAGEKSGIGIFSKNKTSTSSSSSPSAAPAYYQHQQSNPGRPPPPLPGRSSDLGPPPPPRRPTHLPPPPPPRRLDTSRSSSPCAPPPSTTLEQPPPPPPPPVSRKPSSVASPPVYRPPPIALNGYGPPSMTPVQPSTRYGPPSPPPSVSFSQDTHSPPPPPSIPKRVPPAKPIKSISSQVNAKSTPPPAYISANKHKHGQVPFPPFSQFTEADKIAFFELLDDFFGQRFPDRRPQQNNQTDSPPPPQVSLRNRPQIKPLAQPTLSRAYTLAAYFTGYHSWSAHSDQWYTHSDPVPTPVQASTDIKRMSAWTQTGSTRTQTNYILFADLSQIWTTVTFDVNRPFPPRNVGARYRPPPGPFETDQLVAAAQCYGPQLVLFGEQAERSGRHVARGECWDMANEALLAFPADQFGILPPLTSISRTHGHLMYYGRATHRGVGQGEWKAGYGDLGGIRPGDIIEWRLVACDTVNPKLMCTLGDPDHTALIVQATQCTISDPANAPPSQLGHITVIEQSIKQIPVRRTYDLTTMSRGEVWIYRPMSVNDLLGEGRDQCSFPPPGISFEA